MSTLPEAIPGMALTTDPEIPGIEAEIPEEPSGEPGAVEMPEAETPIYIWIIVAIGAVLTIAVIVLIIRTRRVV